MKRINRIEFIKSLAIGGVALGLPNLTACAGHRNMVVPVHNGRQVGGQHRSNQKQ
jgi:hypothetical protein